MLWYCNDADSIAEIRKREYLTTTSQDLSASRYKTCMTKRRSFVPNAEIPRIPSHLLSNAGTQTDDSRRKTFSTPAQASLAASPAFRNEEIPVRFRRITHLSERAFSSPPHLLLECEYAIAIFPTHNSEAALSSEYIRSPSLSAPARRLRGCDTARRWSIIKDFVDSINHPDLRQLLGMGGASPPREGE